MFAVAGESEAEGFSEARDRRRLRSGAQADVIIVAWGKGIKLGGLKIFMTNLALSGSARIQQGPGQESIKGPSLRIREVTRVVHPAGRAMHGSGNRNGKRTN